MSARYWNVPDARYLPNAVEAGRFDQEPRPNPALADEEFAKLVATGKPIAGYYGALARWFDYALLEATAQRRPDWSFVLIGPDHDGSLARSGVARLPNVHWLGTRPYVALPGYLHRFDVATIPFAINEITLATSPLKLYEYFAAGRPVISTPMPECAAFAEVQLVKDAEQFAAALDVARARAGDAGLRQRLHGIATANTWRSRARETMALVEQRRAGAVPSVAVGINDPDQAPRELRRRFAHLETKHNRHLFRALSRHLAGTSNDADLRQHFEFAMSANARGQVEAKALDTVVPVAGKRTLDVGCSYGGLLLALAELGADPTGIDTDEALLRLAEQNFVDAGRRLGVHLADVTNAEDVARFRRMFDLIACNDLLQRTDDPATCLVHLASMLREAGVLYIELPNPDDIATILASGTSDGANARLRLDELARLLHCAGLSTEIVYEPDSVHPPEAIREQLAARRTAAIAIDRGRDLDEAEAAPIETPDDRMRFAVRYGMSTWKVVARRQADESPPPGVPLVDVLPPRSVAHMRFLRGVCNMCGRTTRFFHDDPTNDRESLTCQHCRATSRYRSIARGVLRGDRGADRHSRGSVAELPAQTPPACRSAAYETQPAFFTRRAPIRCPATCSAAAGSTWRSRLSARPRLRVRIIGAGRRRTMNLERLTFPDGVFDLVVTSDVMEHVRNDARAHAEIPAC